MSSTLLPRRPQVATLIWGVSSQIGSKLPPLGSRRVAAWVAAWVAEVTLTYGFQGLRGSRGSSFLNKLRVKEKEKEGREYKGNNRDKLLHLLPRYASRAAECLGRGVTPRTQTRPLNDPQLKRRAA